jgi:hypothetical protein
MEVLLNVGNKSFFLELEEAMKVANILCCAQYLGNEWRSTSARNLLVRKQPESQAASISPVTAYLILEIEQGEKK